jgi:two-component sensor histidine kinase
VVSDAGGRNDGVLELHTGARTDELAGIRARVHSFVRSAGGDASTADDLELVVSELATNVIEHTSSPTLTIGLVRTPEEWILDVADVEDLSILEDVELPAVTNAFGRGLFIVTKLVDEIAIVDNGETHGVRCRLGAHRAS